jgi:hypothetical protein
LVVSANAKQYLWTGTTGLSSMQSGSITVSAYGSIIANYKTKYYLTVTSAHDSPSPVSGWFDSGTSITDSATSPVPDGPNTQYACTGWSGSGSIPASGSTSSITFTIVQASSITWNWKTQYQISFAQSGVGTDFLSTVVTVDSVNYVTNALPVSFWFDSGSTHAFNYCSPLVVSLGKQYAWSSTTGLTGLQNGILTITNTGSVTGNYITQLKYQIAFAQSGVGSDFNGTIVIVDGNSYNTANIPTFLWDYGSIHSFAFQSSLSVGINSERYVWTSTGGLSSSISGSITVTTSGSLTGNYKIQYYLNVTTSPIGVASPSGTGWYDANTQATVSTSGFVEISPGLSRYRFNGWTTVDMSEITQPAQSPTTVTIDKPKNVTALYAVQFKISFSQTGVSSDFTGKIVTIDINDYTLSNLPAQLWYDSGSTHAFTFNSPLIVSPNAKQYVWTSTSGLSTTEAETITISGSGTITGNYKTQFYLTTTSPHGTPAPGSTWVDAGTSITDSINSPVPGSSGTQYVCTGWTGTGSAPLSGTSTMTTFTMSQQTSVTWNWKTQYYLSVAASPPGIATVYGQGWYDPASHEPLTAPAVPGFAFQYWDVDGSSQGNGVTAITVDMNAPHVATANYATLPQITVTIDPTTATITAGQTVSFTSAVTGGVPPFSYQWYLNSNPVSGATSSSWYFTPTTPGTYYVYLVITDSTGNTGQSATARITINPTPVGGYSISLARKPNTTNIGAYAATIILFGLIITAIKRKRK